MGFVYQFHQLLPEFTALENVLMPQMIRGVRAARRRGAGARSCSSMLGLGERLDHRPAAALGRRAAAHGDRPRARQRAAGCCWPTSRPATSIPTTSAHVFHELLELIRHTGVAALMATHNLALARRMHRVLRLEQRRADRDQSQRR